MNRGIHKSCWRDPGVHAVFHVSTSKWGNAAKRRAVMVQVSIKSVSVSGCPELLNPNKP